MRIVSTDFFNRRPQPGSNERLNLHAISLQVRIPLKVEDAIRSSLHENQPNKIDELCRDFAIRSAQDMIFELWMVFGGNLEHLVQIGHIIRSEHHTMCKVVGLSGCDNTRLHLGMIDMAGKGPKESSCITVQRDACALKISVGTRNDTLFAHGPNLQEKEISLEADLGVFYRKE